VATSLEDISIAERRLARQVLEEAKHYEGTFIIRCSQAAKALGHQGYRSLPQGVRTYISHLGGTIGGSRHKQNGKASKKQPSQGSQMTFDELTPEPLKKKNRSRKKPSLLINDILLPGQATLEEMWFDELQRTSSMQHGLHPEDEYQLSRYFRQQQQADA
jgi:hypothetical protein